MCLTNPQLSVSVGNNKFLVYFRPLLFFDAFKTNYRSLVRHLHSTMRTIFGAERCDEKRSPNEAFVLKKEPKLKDLKLRVQINDLESCGNHSGPNTRN